MHLGGHLRPGHQEIGVGGGGGASVHRHGVGPANGRLPLEEGEAAAGAEVQAVGGVQTPDPAMAGRPPH